MTKLPRAKKSLGQNFLVNPGVVGRIVEAATLKAGDTVLEVGPGTGILTEQLASTGARVIAVEKDRALIDPLREKFTSTPRVEIVEADILEFDPSSHGLLPYSYKVVANIPYYLTSHLIRQMLEEWPPPSCAVLMVQREVATRMQAHPPDMNLFALSVWAYAEAETVMRVSRGSFRPMPDVDSAVIRLVPKNLDESARVFLKHLLGIAKRAFGQKRKRLTATVPAFALTEAGIPHDRRPQQLSLDDWKRIASVLP